MAVQFEALLGWVLGSGKPLKGGPMGGGSIIPSKRGTDIHFARPQGLVFIAQRIRGQAQTLRMPQRRSPGVLLAGQRSIW